MEVNASHRGVLYREGLASVFLVNGTGESISLLPSLVLLFQSFRYLLIIFGFLICGGFLGDVLFSLFLRFLVSFICDLSEDTRVGS